MATPAANSITAAKMIAFHRPALAGATCASEEGDVQHTSGQQHSPASPTPELAFCGPGSGWCSRSLMMPAHADGIIAKRPLHVQTPQNVTDRALPHAPAGEEALTSMVVPATMSL